MNIDFDNVPWLWAEVDRLKAEVTRLTAERDEAQAEVERLTDAISRCLLGDKPGDCYAAECVDLRAEVDRLKAENARLREALAPFAAMPTHGGIIRVKDIDTARIVLTGTRGHDE